MLNFGKILHLGIIVEDFDKAVEIYEKVLGIGPWEISKDDHFFDDKLVNGKNGLALASAIFRGEGYEIEIVSPTGPGIFRDWLDEHGPGLHHIKFETDATYAAITETVKNISGRDPYLDVRWPDGKPLVAYADLLKEAGLLIEVNGL